MDIPHPGNHPTGIAGAVVAILLLIAPHVGIHLTQDQAVAIVGAVVTIVSLFSPRLIETHFFLSPEDSAKVVPFPEPDEDEKGA
jgi:hypothetical protein